MSVLNDFLLANGLDLLIGCSILLTLATLAVALAREPVLKQRFAELGILMTLVWFAAALAPLPRFSLSSSRWFSDPESSTPTEIVPTNNSAPLVSDPNRTSQDAERSNLSLSAIVAESVAGSKQTFEHKSASAPASALGNRTESKAIDWMSLVGVAFVALSVCIAIGMLIVRLILLASFRRCGQPDPWLSDLYESIRREHGGRRATLLICISNWRPMSCGILRPVIVMPADLCHKKESGVLLHILRHEQAHVDRFDAVGNAIMNLALPVLWFHPLYWYLKSTVEFSRELIADDIASASGAKTQYADDLLQLVRRIKFRGSPLAGAMGVLAFRHPFTRRMAMLVNRKQTLRRRLGRRASMGAVIVAGLAVVVLAGFLGAEPVLAQDASAPKNDPTQQISSTKTNADAGNTAAAEGSDGLYEDQPLVPAETFHQGVVEAIDDLTIHALQEGQVKEILVKAGETVKKGQLLMRLHDLELTQSAKTAALELRIQERQLAGLLELRNKNAVTSTEVERAKLETEQASLSLELLGERLSRQEIHSPIDGVLNQIHAKPGQPVTRGDKLARVVNLEKLRVRVNIPATPYGSLDLVGRKVHVKMGRNNSTADNPLQLQGEIVYVSSNVSLNNSMEIWVACDNIRGKNQFLIRPGMIASVGLGEMNESDSESNSNRFEAIELSKPTGGNANRKDETSEEEIELLRDLITLHEKTAAIARANFESGMGTSAAVHAANADLHLTKARLAVALGKFDDAEKQYADAIKKADETAKEMQYQYEHGVASSFEVSRLHKAAMEIKLEWLKYKRLQK